jgi:hypothetical protein
MFQQIIAIIIILFFIAKLFLQKKKKEINILEFSFWFLFWLVSGFVIFFIKKIDGFVSALGFSAKGIDVLVYLSIVVIFYLIFKLFIKIEKQERNITKLTREISLNNFNKDK